MAKKTIDEIIDNAPLRYAPANELGVVFLFAHLAKKWRITIDSISSSFPDCIAYRKSHGKESRIRIEFEYKSRNFKTHGHDPKKCDWIVCWEHNWPGAPKRLNIIELRREFGLGFNVWIMPVGERFKQAVETLSPRIKWSLPSQCHKGDLLLYYFTHPDACIKHVYQAKERATTQTAGWKPGKDYMGSIRRVCKLAAPIFLEDMRRDRVLSTSGFIRGRMQGRRNATEYWPYLHEMIIRRNPSIKKTLNKFSPENV